MMGKLNRRVFKHIPTSHWELITSSGEDVCFVCDKHFKKGYFKKVYVGKSTTNEKLFRHESCDAFSENWSKKFGCLNHKL